MGKKTVEQKNWEDFKQAIAFCDYWLTLGWWDVAKGYTRMKLGIFWVPMTQLIFVAILGILYAMILNYPVEVYVPYLASGVITWNMIRAVIMESGRAYISHAQLLLNSSITPCILVLRMVWRNTLLFFLNLIVHFVVLIYFQVTWSWEILLFPIGVAFIFLNAIWVGLVLAYYCAQYRDLLQIVNNLMQPMFFITPILWVKDRVGGKAALFSDWNPFYNFIELVRAPLLMKVPDAFSYWYVAAITLGGIVFAIWVVRHSGRRVVYWL